MEAKSDSHKRRTPEEAQKNEERKTEREGNKRKGKETKIRHGRDEKKRN